MTTEKLEGPVDFESDDTPTEFDGVVQVHLEIDGTLTVFTNHQGDAATTHGMLTPALMNTLHSDIASVDLETTPQVYECSHYECSGSGQAFETLMVSANGQTFNFVVDRDIDDSVLPAALVRLLDDLSSLPAQAH